MGAALLTAFLWSLSATASSRAARALGTWRVNRLRLAISLLLLAMMLAITARPWSGPGAGWFLLSGAVGLGLGDIAMFAAFRRVGARLTVLLTQCLAVPVAWLGEWAWLGHAPGVASAALAAVVVLGVAIALTAGHPLAPASGERRWVGVGFGVLSACGLAVAGVISRAGFAAADGALDGLSAAALRNAAGFAVMLVLWPAQPLTLVLHRRLLVARDGADAGTARLAAEDAPQWRAGLPWLLGSAVVGPCIGVATYQWALSQAEAGAVQAVIAVTPVLVMPLAWLLEGDRPKPAAVLGGVLAVAAAGTLAAVH